MEGGRREGEGREGGCRREEVGGRRVGERSEKGERVGVGERR